ncbi:hypothetical protein SacRon12I_05130 [Sulfolobus acidocaldarius Ron12/I]|nr:hypothetical protein SacRon12I_05130 [Sulfolobus acidocaldarius Ron12/I]
MFVAAISQLLWLNFASITTPIMTDLYNVPAEDIGLLSAIWPLIFIPLSIPAGIITDKKGFKYAVSLGALIMAVFSVARIFSGENFTLLLIFQSLAGVGQPFVYTSISKMVIEWFEDKERGLATGLAVIGQFLGLMSALIFTPMLVPDTNFSEFQTMLIVYSAISVLSLIIFTVVAKEKKVSSTESNMISFGVVKGVLKSTDFIILNVLFFIGIGFFTGILTWIESILEPRGISVTDSGVIAGLILIGGIFGSIVIPFLSDKLQRKKMFFLLDFGISAIMLYFITVSNDFIILSVSTFLLGFFLVSALPIGLDYSAQLVEPNMTGTIQSILWLIAQGGAVLLIPVMGSLENPVLYPNNPFLPSMILVIILDVVSLVLSLFLREGRAKNERR